MSSGTNYVHLQIVHANSSALLAMTPVVVTSNPSVGWGGAFHFARGSGERLFSMPPAKSTLIKVFGAPLVAATC